MILKPSIYFLPLKFPDAPKIEHKIASEGKHPQRQFCCCHLFNALQARFHR